jgi:indole-3-glycerol phosphate synthase
VSEFLEKILLTTREDLQHRKRRVPVDELAKPQETRAAGSFARAIAAPGISVIAEIKRASPSKGLIRPRLDVAAIATAYERAGAGAVSVLTEERHFLGSLADLRKARAACSLPLLRKDFIIDPYQIWEAAANGADAVLLIVAALSGDELQKLHDEAKRMGLECLVEVHDEEELKRALEIEAPLIGINNRNLRTFKVSLDTTLNLIESVPSDRLVVSESGIRDRADVSLLAAAGVSAVLVGETLMCSPDPGKKLEELRGKI